MSQPLTQDLLEQLLSSCSISEFLDQNIFQQQTLAQCLQQLLVEQNLKKSVVIKRSFLNQTFAYQIFSGERQASRDKVLQLAFAMQLSLAQCQRLLKSANVNELYCKNRRDAVLIYCLNQKVTLEQTQEALHQFNEPLLFDA